MGKNAEIEFILAILILNHRGVLLLRRKKYIHTYMAIDILPYLADLNFNPQ